MQDEASLLLEGGEDAQQEVVEVVVAGGEEVAVEKEAREAGEERRKVSPFRQRPLRGPSLRRVLSAVLHLF